MVVKYRLARDNCPRREVRVVTFLASTVTWPTPCDIFLRGYNKDRVYVPPMPRYLPQLRQRFVEAAAAIDRQMLQSVWQELEYRIDICRVTKGGHIEHL